MSWVDELLKDIPATERYKRELRGMEEENASLKTENALLRKELDTLRTRVASPDALETEMEQVLVFISQEEYATAATIAQALSLSAKAVEMYIDELMRSNYIEVSHASSDNAQYYLKQKGKRYLHGLGLL
jgi:DNA-binding MarR family transcriptional regulator